MYVFKKLLNLFLKSNPLAKQKKTILSGIEFVTFSIGSPKLRVIQLCVCGWENELHFCFG